MHNGHNKKDKELHLVGNNTAVDPFGKNIAASLAYKKMERLVTATYMITNFVPKNENLRQRVRDIANNLLTDTINLRSGLTSLGAGALENIVAQVRLILSLLDVLYASGLISEMNLKVLKEAYKDFAQNLSFMAQGKLNDGIELTQEYFLQKPITESHPNNDGAQENLDITRLSQHKNHKNNKQRKLQHKKIHNPSSASIYNIDNNTNKQDAKNISKYAITAYNKKNNQKTPASAKYIFNDRAQTILDFITKRGSASTGDLAGLITNCSSKTLQRDLAKLVANGTLKKQGEKRWTRYSLCIDNS